MQTIDSEHLRADFEEFRAELLRLVRALGIGSTGAEDILQEVYLTAREKCPPTLPPEDLRRWLIHVTANRCRLEHRRAGRWRRAFEKLTHFFERHHFDPTADEPVESLDREEARQHIRQSLDLLPAETRMLLVLRYFAELNSTEIGKIFNLPEATVRGRLRAARQKLADQLRRKGYRPDE